MPARMNQESKFGSLDRAFKARLDRRCREIASSYQTKRADWSPSQIQSAMQMSKWEEEAETEAFQSELEDQLAPVKEALNIPFEIMGMDTWIHFDSWESINKKDFNSSLRHCSSLSSKLNRVFESLMANSNVFLDDELDWLFTDFLVFVSYRQIERERHAEFIRQFAPHLQRRMDQVDKVAEEGWSALLPLVVSRIFAKKPSAEELAFMNNQYAIMAREVSKIQRIVFNAYNELGANAINWAQFKQYIDQSRAEGMSYPTSIDLLLKRKLDVANRKVSSQIPTLK